MSAIGAVAAAKTLQNEKVIAKLKDEIWKLWKNDNLENRYGSHSLPLRICGFRSHSRQRQIRGPLSARLAIPGLAKRSMFLGCGGAVVEVGRIASVPRRTSRINLNELKLPGNSTVIPGLVNSSVLDGVLQIEECPNVSFRIIRVNQHGATLQQVAITLQNQVNRCCEQGVEMKILHMITDDPARTPNLVMFADPDYFLFAGAPNCDSPCVTEQPGFAWNHGDVQADITTTWLGLVGPGIGWTDVSENCNSRRSRIQSEAAERFPGMCAGRRDNHLARTSQTQ